MANSRLWLSINGEAMKAIGPTFDKEIRAAGLGGLPFSWGTDGDIQYGPAMTQAQKDAVQAVYAAHDPVASLAADQQRKREQAVRRARITAIEAKIRAGTDTVGEIRERRRLELEYRENGPEILQEAGS